MAHGGGKRCEVEGCNKSTQAPGNRCISHGGGRRCRLAGCFKRAQRGKPRCLGHMRDPTACICQFDICPIVLDNVTESQESMSSLLCGTHKNQIEAVKMARSVNTGAYNSGSEKNPKNAKAGPIIQDILERLEAQMLRPVRKDVPHNSTSHFKGVTKLGSSYQATLGIRKTNVYLGRYASEYEAGTAYVVAAAVRSHLIPFYKPNQVPKDVLKRMCMQALERIPSLSKRRVNAKQRAKTQD